MSEREPESSSDIVDRAMGELRSSPVPSELPPELLDVLFQAAREDAGAATRTVRVATTVHPTLLARSLNTWRWIMRSPVSRVAAAAIFICALGGVTLWFHGAGARFSLADFARPIVEAKTAKYKMTYEMEGRTPKVSTVMVLAPCRTREESREELPGKIVVRLVTITDYQKGRILVLDNAHKTATMYTLDNVPEGMRSANWFDGVRRHLLDARIKREPLGEKEIDGHRAVGYRLTRHAHGGTDSVMTLWGNPETGLPDRIEVIEQRSGKEMKVTMSDFVFNFDLDESLFGVEPRAGYTTRNLRIDSSPPVEKDLIEALRWYAQQGGGVFPDLLDLRAAFTMNSRTTTKTTLKLRTEWKDGKQQTSEVSREVSKPAEKEAEQQSQKEMDAFRKVTNGQSFALQLPVDADGHYAGKGVSLGAADKPIFWYRSKDAKKYRVIYGDLSVHDADAPPKAANAQAVPGQADPKR
jgi:outer membrane lipoprotein-sorting protein